VRTTKVRELKEVLAGADDEADVIVTRHTRFEDVGVMKFGPRDIFGTVGAVVQPSGKALRRVEEDRLMKTKVVVRSDRHVGGWKAKPRFQQERTALP
jgi:hypothetical protein